MTDNIFETASRTQLRFTTHKGQLSVEDLWDLPLQSTRGNLNLDDLAKAVNANLKNSEVESFVNKSAPANVEERLRLEILKHVIAVKMLESEEKANARANKERKQMLLNALAEKRSENLSNMSEEEIQAQLEALK